MLKSEQIKSLKKMNASKDPDKSRVRVDEGYKSTTRAQKNEIEALSGLKANSFYNAGKSGSASPKVVLSLAQVLGVTPFYFTGETDEMEPISDKLINQFLVEIGANKPTKPKRPYNRRAGTEKIERTAAVKAKRAAGKIKSSAKSVASKAASGVERIAVPKVAAAKSKRAVDLSKDEIITLVSALHIRAGLSEEAKKKLDGIKAILLS